MTSSVLSKGPSVAQMVSPLSPFLIIFLLGRPIAVIDDDGFFFFAGEIFTELCHGAPALYTSEQCPGEDFTLALLQKDSMRCLRRPALSPSGAPQLVP